MNDELFGVALRAFAYVPAGQVRLLEALAGGHIRAGATRAAPSSEIPLLNNADVGNPDWWASYLAGARASGGLALPQLWSAWLHSEVRVDIRSSVDLLAELLEGQRTACQRTQARHLHEGAWSDLEAIAWLASADERLVTGVRDFAHQQPWTAQKSRKEGLHYLAFHVAQRHCACGMQPNPLVAIEWPDSCVCVFRARSKLVAALQDGALTAKWLADGALTAIEPCDFLLASGNTQDREFKLLDRPGEILMRRNDVIALQATPKILPYSDDERRHWIEKQPDDGGADPAFKRYQREPRYCGTKRDAFRSEWKDVHQTKPGRPAKRTPRKSP